MRPLGRRWRMLFLGLCASACSQNLPTSVSSNSEASPKGPRPVDPTSAEDDQGTSLQAARTKARAKLVPPSLLPRIFWRQRLKIRHGERAFGFTVVVQNDGNEFIVLALGPANTRLFVIEQTDAQVTLERFVEREIPIEPEFFLLDMQRAVFWFEPGERRDLGTLRRSFRGDCLLDEWSSRGLSRRIVISDQGDCAQIAEPASGARLSIEYRPEYVPGEEPERVEMIDEHRDYRLSVQHLETLDSP